MDVRGTVQRMGKVGRMALVCVVILALFLQEKSVAFATTTSPWTTQTSYSDIPINGAAYGVGSNGQGLWVTGESNGKIDTSPDGVTWAFSRTQIDPNFNDYFSSAVYGSEWVLVGQIGEIVTSPDGSTWTKQNTPANTPDLLGVAYGGGTYVAVGQSGTILTSTNGTNWSSQTAGSDEFWGVAYGNGQFVAVSSNGRIYTSSDGISWTSRTFGTSSSFDCVTFGGGLFVAAGDNGTIRTSTDGVTWTSRTSGTSNNLYGIAYGAGKYVAVGYGLDNSGVVIANSLTMMSSTDGNTWSPEQPDSEPSGAFLDCVAYGGSKFVAGGGDGGDSNYPGIIQTEAFSNNTDLSGLALSAGTLSPTFSSGTTSYTTNVPNSVSSVDVTPTLADSAATLTVNGSAATSGSGVSVPLNVGSTDITVVVTAQDGSTQKTYTITVTRAAALSSNANLGNLSLDQGTLSPTFSSSTTTYTADVGETVTSVDVTPTVADSTATVTVNAAAATSGSATTVPLNVGPNAITVQVTAQDGFTTQTFTVTVTRSAAPILSNNDNLIGLTVSVGTLTPAFSSGNTSYRSTVANSVTSLRLTSTVADNTATVTVDGQAATSGSPSNVSLNIGVNTVSVLVTAQDGTTKTYTISITRQGVTPGPIPIPTPPLTPANPPVIKPGKPGEPFEITLAVTGGTAPYSWSILFGALPSGLHLDPATGVISGTTKQTKPAIVSFQAVDATGKIVTEQVVVDVVPQGQREMVWGTSNLQAANVPAIVAKDAGTDTTYMPIWYVMQMLKSYGVNSVWDGNKWSLTTNTSDLSTTTLGRGTLGIYVNGKLVQMATGIAAGDPNSKNKTTYMPIQYVQQLMNTLNIQNTWDGTTWTVS